MSRAVQIFQGLFPQTLAAKAVPIFKSSSHHKELNGKEKRNSLTGDVTLWPPPSTLLRIQAAKEPGAPKISTKSFRRISQSREETQTCIASRVLATAAMTRAAACINHRWLRGSSSKLLLTTVWQKPSRTIEVVLTQITQVIP